MHRLHNRNTGYTEASNFTNSLATSQTAISATEGATALNLDNVIQENEAAKRETEIVKNNELSSGEIDFLPKAGRLLIFPSWTKHKVQSNLKDNTRIVYSFNSIIEK